VKRRVLIEDIRSGGANLHTVMAEFASGFRATGSEPSKLTGLASLLNLCIERPGSLKNAAAHASSSTCARSTAIDFFGNGLSPEVKTYIRTSQAGSPRLRDKG
jgi:hypothetical protein